MVQVMVGRPEKRCYVHMRAPYFVVETVLAEEQLQREEAPIRQ